MKEFQAHQRLRPNIISIINDTGEVWFHLSGFVISLNFRYWTAENAHVIIEHALHSDKICVWCTISAMQIVGLILFYKNVNSEAYAWLFIEFVKQLGDIKLTQGYFQNNGSICHTSSVSEAFITSFFGDHIISKDL